MFRKQQLKVITDCTIKSDLDVASDLGKTRTFAMWKNHCTLLSGLMAVGLWACLPPTPLLCVDNCLKAQESCIKLHSIKRAAQGLHFSLCFWLKGGLALLFVFLVKERACSSLCVFG
jgi:hypothetical protein